MKRFKTLLQSLLPLLLAYGIQSVLAVYFVILGVIISMIVYVGRGGHLDNMLLENIAFDPHFNGLLMISFSVACMLIFGVWYYSSCNGSFAPQLKRTFHPLKLLGLFLLVPGAQFLSTVLIYFMYTYAPAWIEQYQELMETAGMTDDASITIIIYSVLCAPISEELIFRGVTMNILKRRFPFWFANLFQALLFGIFHGNIVQGIYAFVLGMFLGYVCEYGGSIWYSILFHFLFNLWGTSMDLFDGISDLTFFLISLGGMVFFLSLGMLLYHIGVHRKQTTHTA